MITKKNFDKIALAVTVIMLWITILFMNGDSLGLEVKLPEIGYDTRLFDNTKVHTIDIIMDDWQSFIDNAQSEEYSPATVVIDGETFKSVGIRGKGNTSLSSVAGLDSERYSFKIEFDQYDSGKSYYGLDKLALNNLIQDSTMMKDYLTYTMMNEFGVNTPLCSFAYITVNGEDWGLYLAVEGVEDSFLQRNYGENTGELYKPDSMSFGGGRGNGQDFRMSEFWKENFTDSDSENAENTEKTETERPNNFPTEGGFNPGAEMPAMPDMGNMPPMPGGDIPRDFDPDNMSSDFTPPDMGERGGRGMGFGGMGSSDVKLQYIDDDFDSYSNIWNNAKTDISNSDKTRLIQSLKKLSENEDIESVVNVEEVIRYFVVHNYVCNDDSYTGMMIHNYYLHEKDGKLSMLPWDYNLAFGTMHGNDATDTVNTPIDSPVTGGSSDRPMLNWIFENEEYTELYHQYFSEFLESVDVIGIIDAAYELIAPYVEKDPTSFYSYDEFEKGVETLRGFCTLRIESIKQQLENGETTERMNYADASSLNLSDMGSMNNGKTVLGEGGGRMHPGGMDRRPGQADENGTRPAPDMTRIPGESRTENPETQETGPMPEFSPEITDTGEKDESACDSPDCPETQTPTAPESDSAGRFPKRDGMGMMPPNGPGFPGGGEARSGSSTSVWIWLGTTGALLAAGLLIAGKFRY